MLFVGLFQVDRAKDLEFWAVLWQGQGPPSDFELVAAYNLMTDMRVIVFRAETVQAIRFLDRLNMVGRFTCHPALDQTDGYRAALARDVEGLGAFVRGRGAREEAAQAGVEFRRQAMEQPNLWAALLLADEWKQRGNRPT